MAHVHTQTQTITMQSQYRILYVIKPTVNRWLNTQTQTLYKDKQSTPLNLTHVENDNTNKVDQSSTVSLQSSSCCEFIWPKLLERTLNCGRSSEFCTRRKIATVIIIISCLWPLYKQMRKGLHLVQQSYIQNEGLPRSDLLLPLPIEKVWITN